MASSVLNAKFTGFATAVPDSASGRIEAYRETFEANRHRIYSLAFWATDNEMTAEEVSTRVFCKAFAKSATPSEESIDRMLIAVLRESMPVGTLTLNQTEVCTEIAGARRNIKRVVLERAVMELPITERLVFMMHDVERYDHKRISRLLGLKAEESQFGLHQARLHLRQSIAANNFSF